MRTDIKVDAISKAGHSRTLSTITAVIKTKGCWEPGADDGHEDTAGRRPSGQTGCPVGIYLVGWFDKPKWGATDYRRARTPDWTVEQAQSHLD